MAEGRACTEPQGARFKAATRTSRRLKRFTDAQTNIPPSLYHTNVSFHSIDTACIDCCDKHLSAAISPLIPIFLPHAYFILCTSKLDAEPSTICDWERF